MLLPSRPRETRSSAVLLLFKWVSAAAIVFAPVAVSAQVVAPSQVVPHEIEPVTPPSQNGIPIERHAPTPAVTPAEDYLVEIGAVELKGAFPEMSAANAGFISTVSHKRQPLSALFKGAHDLEKAYTNQGYVFARIVVPPQRLVEDGPVRVEVVDGYIESVDVSRLPVSIQSAVRSRIRGLVGKRHLTQAELERAMLLAGELSGIKLRSALARGDQPGGVRLVIEGQVERVQGRVNTDNRLPPSLARWQWNANVAFNNLLGKGEQTYLFGGSQFDILSHGFRRRPPLGMIGGGVVVPVSPSGLTLGGELLLARTEPDHRPDIPMTVGHFSRGQFSLKQPLLRSRSSSIDARFEMDFISQSVTLPEFGTTLSRDRYAAIRMELGWKENIDKYYQSFNISFSQGVSGRKATSLQPASRDGARNDFSTLQVSGRIGRPLPGGFALEVQARAQSSFGKPLFLSEQFALDTDNAVSTFPGGTFNVDSGATVRTELILPGSAPFSRLTLSPYFFAAGGVGSVERATAVEQGILRAGAAGFGGRVNLAGLPGLPHVTTAVGVEFGHQFSNASDRHDGNRASVTASVRF